MLDTNQHGNQGNQNKSYTFQVPVMLTPGEVVITNNQNPSSRIIGENANSNNIDIHIHAVFGPLRNQLSKLVFCKFIVYIFCIFYR